MVEMTIGIVLFRNQIYQPKYDRDRNWDIITHLKSRNVHTTSTSFYEVCKSKIGLIGLQFLEKCLQRRVYQRPEASELIGDPFIYEYGYNYFEPSGSRSKSVHPSPGTGLGLDPSELRQGTSNFTSSSGVSNRLGSTKNGLLSETEVIPENDYNALLRNLKI